MLNESLIKSKFEELYEKYSNRSIDDYENFVLSRTIEHFFNTERLPIDELTDLAAATVKGAGSGTAHPQVSNEDPDTAKTDKTTSAVRMTPKRPGRHPHKRCAEGLLAFFRIACVIVTIREIVHIFRSKK